jgi:hypothetical protein
MHLVISVAAVLNAGQPERREQIFCRPVEKELK